MLVPFQTGEMKKTLTIVSVLGGIALALLGALYLITPAGSLPSYLPGFEAGSAHIHLKHGIASIFLALALFAFTWFKSGEQAG